MATHPTDTTASLVHKPACPLALSITILENCPTSSHAHQQATLRLGSPTTPSHPIPPLQVQHPSARLSRPASTRLSSSFSSNGGPTSTCASIAESPILIQDQPTASGTADCHPFIQKVNIPNNRIKNGDNKLFLRTPNSKYLSFAEMAASTTTTQPRSPWHSMGRLLGLPVTHQEQAVDSVWSMSTLG